MAKRRYVWPKQRLLNLDCALALVQTHTEAPVSLCSPLGETPGQYRNTVFFWLPNAHCGVVWQADKAQHVHGDIAAMIADKLEYATWRQANPDRECLDCREQFLPARGWTEAGYPADVCPRCVARALAVVGPEQLFGTAYDPRAIFQRSPSESSVDDLDGPIDAL